VDCCCGETDAEGVGGRSGGAGVRKSGVGGKLEDALRKRHPLTNVILVLFYIGQVVGFASLIYNSVGVLLRLESGFFFALVVLTWITFMGSLEAIRKWNRLGFFLYLTSCAMAFTLQAWASLAGILIPLVVWIRPLICPAILWVTLQIGSPTGWEQMDRHNLLRDMRP